jgi:hypothetical protein
MVKSAKYRVRTDDSGPLNRANSRRVFAQRPMRSDVVITACVRSQDPTQMHLAQDNDDRGRDAHY